MIPLIKVVSLLFRVFSKPLINYTKMYHATNEIKSNWLRLFFVMLGNKYHRFQNYINKRYLKVNNEFAFKPLNDNLALQKGIEFFYEIIFYMIILGFPISQLYVASVESKQKSNILNNRLKSIDEKSKDLKEKIERLIELKKTNQKIEDSLTFRYKLQNIGEIKPNQNSKTYCLDSSTKLYYGNKLVKQFKHCVAF